MRTRLQAEQGFGLIELMISMVMLNVGILAIIAAFNSGGLAIQRASGTAAATVLADKQMELYRALTYANVALDTTATATANADTTYQCDTANKIDPAGACGGANQQTSITVTCGTLTAQCDPRRTATGPDGRSYRVDTYIAAETPPDGRAVRRVTVVVRRSTDSSSLARVTSTFDQSTG